MLEEFTTRMMAVLCIISGIPLLAASLSGLLVAMVQSATQIQEQSIVFTVKLVVGGGCLYFTGDWCLEQLKECFIRAIELLSLVH